MNVSAWMYLHDGAITAAAKLIEESDTYISRQYLDAKTLSWSNGLNYWTAKTNQYKALYQLSEDKGEVDMDIWQNYIDARSDMYRNLGAIQLHQQLLMTIDMRPVKYELQMEIIESDKKIDDPIFETAKVGEEV